MGATSSNPTGRDARTEPEPCALASRWAAFVNVR